MTDLSVEISRVEFENPILIGSSVLTNRLDKLRKLAAAGAGGVVTKLIQPPELIPQFHEMASKVVATREGYFLVGDAGMKLNDGVNMIKNAKKELNIPVIASIGGRPNDLESWVGPAKALTEAGADMLELDMWPDYGITEPKACAYTMKELKESSGVPVIMKMTPLVAQDYVAVAKAGASAGGDAVSGANVLAGICPPDINNDFKNPYPNVVKMGLLTPIPYFGHWQNPISLAYTIRLVRQVGLPVISGGGVMGWEDAVQRLACGAHAVSLVSSLVLNGLAAIKSCKDGIEGYMTKKGWSNLKELRGKALGNYSDGDELVVNFPPKGEFFDQDHAWPNRLPDEWWSTPA